MDLDIMQTLQKRERDPLFQVQRFHVDFSGNCNIRCPYCVNDFSRIHGNVRMTEEVYAKVLSLLPLLVPGGKLLFSYFFEPTLNQKLLDYIAAVPPEYLTNSGFTSNLAKPQKQEFFERISRSGLHHINVSLDSLNPPIFEEMRKGAKFKNFIRNLEELVKAFAGERDSPELHFITVVSNRNIDEVPQLVQECASRFSPDRHEVRCFWLTEEMEEREWVEDARTTAPEFLELRKKLEEEAPGHVEVVYDLQENPLGHTPFQTRGLGRYEQYVESLREPLQKRFHTVPMETVLQIDSSGVLRFLMAEPEVQVDLKQLEDPLSVIRSLVFLQNQNIERARVLRRGVKKSLRLERLLALSEALSEEQFQVVESPSNVLGYLDQVVYDANTPGGDEEPLPRAVGWAMDPSCSAPAQEIMVTARQGRNRWVLGVERPHTERLDVARSLDRENLLFCGWDAELHLQALRERLPGRFAIEAYVLSDAERKLYLLDGAREIELS